jgi:hypothetical protein
MGLASAANQLIMVLLLTYFMLLSDQLFKRNSLRSWAHCHRKR